MKRVSTKVIILLLAFTAILACENSMLIEPGVSKELAEYRKSTISNVHYELHFTIPNDLNSVVKGQERLSFDYTGSEPIILDFKVDSVEQICQIKLGNAEPRWKYIDEHIVIYPESKIEKVELFISFIAGNRSLNRNPEFLYTLAVPDRARTIYPCFDQPDMKSCYTLKLAVPEQWIAVSGSKSSLNHNGGRGIRYCAFDKSLPMSTYHFSFVVGKFECYTKEHNGNTVNIYYRETNPDKVAQLDDIADLTFSSVEWLESYTGLKMPYTKNDLAIIPGFQFGGMEHPGLILYADHVVFKEKNATSEEYFQRASTIAHENTHLWFGDLVTMKWFNDVWTKEVFANYISAKIVEPEFPDLDHRLNFVTSYVMPAMAEDRTRGTNAIQQELDNMQNAGLLYGNIIYDKAPVMMRNLERIMGEESFRLAIQEYLRSYYHSNATWDDLITIMSKYADGFNVEEFSHVWVKESGMPHLQLSLSNNKLIVEHVDPLEKGLFWPQRFGVMVFDTSSFRGGEFNIEIKKMCDTIHLTAYEGDVYTELYPNTDGYGYGRVTVPNIDVLLNRWTYGYENIEILSLMLQLHEEYLNGSVQFDAYYNSILDGIKRVDNEQICLTLASELFFLLGDATQERRIAIESDLFDLTLNHKSRAVADMIYRSLAVNCRSEKMVNYFYKVWQEGDNSKLTEKNYIDIALSLALKMPQSADRIISEQRERITNQDVLRRYNFIAPACSADTVVMDSVFNALLDAKNRGVEPWVQSALSYLNSDIREPYSNKYILPALMELQEVQQTGDIFFPKGWCNALLSGHRSIQALHIVERFLNDNPDYPQLLKNKLLQSIYNLERVNRKN